MFRHIISAVAAAALALGIAASASAQSFTEGEQYLRVPAAASVQVPEGKVEVREFFWYGCPHCYTLEPYIRKWDKPAAVEFVTTPALLGKNWVAHAYAYYALKGLRRLEDLHSVLFEAIHEKKMRLATAGQIAKFLKSYEIDEDKFREAFESFAVDAQVKQAERLGKTYGISSVPAFVINGKYVTAPSMVGSYETFFKVVDYLVAKEAG